MNERLMNNTVSKISPAWRSGKEVKVTLDFLHTVSIARRARYISQLFE